jgi:saccharopine dehydrogenase-like NADP-dependent oxidoreductase
MTSSGPVVPREALAAVLNRLSATDGEPSDREVIDVRVAGTSGGAPATYRCLASFEPSPEGMSAGAFGTAIPIATTVRWLAEGRVPAGVHPPETAFDPTAFVGVLEREGVGFSGELLA